MPSQLKSDTARINGAKSQGPTTPEGRAKSSPNSLRHGLTSKAILVADESAEEFQLLLDGYMDQFEPQTGVEAELVETMAIARWRLRRLLAIETNLLETEIARHAEIDGKFNSMDGNARIARVFKTLSGSGQSLTLIIRYEGALNRSYDRAFKQLQLLQATRQSQSAPPTFPVQRNEPKAEPASVPDSPFRPLDLEPLAPIVRDLSNANADSPGPQDRPQL